jgi:hypothetical protein
VSVTKIESEAPTRLGRVQNLAAFVVLVCKLGHDEGFLWRGQQENWDLKPKLARIKPRNGTVEDAEKEMLRELRRRSVGLAATGEMTEWDLLALAQHHGMATRLLDWTENPLAALWFAVAEGATSSDQGFKDGIVWLFRAKSIDFADTESNKPFAGERTMFFRPNHITDRIRVQQGYFSVHKYMSALKRFVALNRNPRYRPKLSYVEIPGQAFADIRAQLDRLGVNRASLFPGLDGLCCHLQWLHSLEADE